MQMLDAAYQTYIVNQIWPAGVQEVQGRSVSTLICQTLLAAFWSSDLADSDPDDQSLNQQEVRRWSVTAWKCQVLYFWGVTVLWRKWCILTEGRLGGSITGGDLNLKHFEVLSQVATKPNDRFMDNKCNHCDYKFWILNLRVNFILRAEAFGQRRWRTLVESASMICKLLNQTQAGWLRED